MSLQNVIERLANIRESRRNSQGGVSHRNSSPEQGFALTCESGESLSLLHTCAGARAHARARAEKAGTGDSQDSRVSQPAPSLNVTLLKHCRCMDCRRFHQDARGEFFCESYIGGTRVEWATGKRYCDPPPDAWHYCADYHGPQISKDVWAWPRRSHAEVAGVAGPSGGPREDNHGGNGRAAPFFRSIAPKQGKEAQQP